MEEKPNNPSSDHAAMAGFWEMVDAILGGTKAMRAAGEKYLPKFEVESTDEYKARLKHARFTNVYRDVVENLAQRPFSKEVTLEDGASESFQTFAEDVDGRGNNLHVFAGDLFFAGINNGIDWIMVDYTKDVPESATLAEERSMGARPYWSRYPAKSVLAAYSDRIGGRDEFVHVRLAENVTERDGFKEVTKERVRVLNREWTGAAYAPATYEVFEKQKDKKGVEDWVSIEGPKPISIGVIPMVPFLTGRRSGGGWVVQPPMRDAADVQIELYQQENGLKNAKTLTAFPMLAGNGVDPVIGEDGQVAPLAVGPRTILYGGAATDGQTAGSWEFIEPGAQSLKFLADDIKDTIKELRELGRQPLTAQSGNLTVVTTAVAAQKGNAAIQAWALGMKDALERALQLTGMWLQDSSEATVIVDTDFDLGFGDDESFTHVVTLATGDEPMISREAAIHEAKRRGILDRKYDAEEDFGLLFAQDEPPLTA